MIKYPIPSPFELIGEWFQPGTTDARIPGTLSWSGQRATLQLQGTFSPLRGKIFGDEDQRYASVHGVTTNSQYVTVIDASRTGTNFSVGNAGFRQAERLSSTWIVIGAHVTAATTYKELHFRIPGLHIWLGTGGITQSFTEKAHGSPQTVTYVFEGVPEEVVEVPQMSSSIGWSVGRTFSGDQTTDVSVTTSASLRIAPREPKDLEWFFRQLGKITTLLSFLSGSPMAPDHVLAIPAEAAGDDTRAEVLVGLREAEVCRHRHKSDFFLARIHMETDLAAVVTRWFEIYESIALPSQLALSVLCSRDLWLHVEFLSLMQALEGLHRATMAGLYTSPEAYEPTRVALISAIPEAVSSDHRASLKSRIKYGNEIALGKRLDALVARLDVRIAEAILGGSKVPRSWVETRNYYTHWDETARPEALNGMEMHRANVRLRLLLRALYLDVAGIPPASIIKSLSNASRESQYLLQLNGAARRKQAPDSSAGAILSIDVVDTKDPQSSQQPEE